jgi:hypothetical protein
MRQCECECFSGAEEPAKQTDRMPSINVAPGRLRALTDIFAKHGTVRINVSGMDPLRPPEESPRLSSARRISLRETPDGQIEVQHTWRTRRQRQR